MAIPRFRTEDGTSYCSNCDSQVDGVAVNCPNCGKPFDEERDASHCPSCGAPNLIGSISCMKCGKMMKPHRVEPSPPAETSPKKEEPPKPTEPDAEDEPKEEVSEGKPEQSDLKEAKRRRQSLWELSEPFEKVIRSRRKRLAKINALLERAKQRLVVVEESGSAAESEERAELENQITEIMEEKEEIIPIEEGIAEMERIYRNLLSLQETELEKKQEALKVRLQSFEEEIEKRDKERNNLRSRETELRSKESALQSKIRELEQRELALSNQEKDFKDKLRTLRKEELDMMKKKFMGEPAVPTQKGWPGNEGGVEASVIPDGQGQAPGDSSEREKELNLRITELEGELEKVTREKEKPEDVNQSLTGNTTDVKKVLKILDDLLEKLPDEEIKRFADSEDFRLYEKILKLYEL
ncbi:MAG: hypothetical protein ACE5IO_04020 [Thermoplasmata archaeon]